MSLFREEDVVTDSDGNNAMGANQSYREVKIIPLI